MTSIRLLSGQRSAANSSLMKIILQRHGGELKPDEDYLAAARRELHEETGFNEAIGPVLRERDDVFAVARSEPARWIERYFLVRCRSATAIERAGWTEEERATIQDWRWWPLTDMLREHPDSFKPAWLPELLRSVLNVDVG